MISGGKVRVVRFFSKALVGAQLRWSVTLGKRVSENYRNLSEFGRQIAEQLFDDRFKVVFGANTKSKILICLELLISFINTVTA